MRLALAGLLLVLAQEPPRKPNIVFILADDLGFGHLGSYGQEKIKTPHLDRMAAEGLRFTQAYAGSHVCAPSRSTLMTGLHAGHTAVRANGKERHLYADDVTVAEVLKGAGYATGLFGKWGLGNTADGPGHPNRQGFDEFFGQLCQMHAHFYYPFWVWHNDKRYPLPGNEGLKRGQYVFDETHAKALDFIRRQKDRPFYAYLSYLIPHVELTVPEDSEAAYRGQFPKKAIADPRKGYIGSDDAYATYAGMVGRLDRAVGEVFKLLKELGLDERTLVLFTSDNGAQGGGPWDALVSFFRGTGDLRGSKGSFYEGGIRVPMIARWPGKVRAGAVTDHVTAHWDFLPTAAELVGVAPPPGLDGVSYLPTLLATGEQKKREFLYWEYPYGNGITQAIRSGDFKALQARVGGPFELYNLKDDPSEKVNLAERNPDVLKRLQQLLASARTEERPYPNRPPATVADYVR